MVDFFKNAVTESCRCALMNLKDCQFIEDFYLAGGTALALQIGHRISTDLDFFSASCHLETKDREAIHQILSSIGDFEIISEQDGMLYTKFFKTDVSLIHQPHALLESTLKYHGIQIASLIDIGLMKLAAINSRGTRRDFVDLFCLKDFITLDRLLELSEIKYADRPSFQAISARALAYFEDAEQQPMPDMLRSVHWLNVRVYCEAASRKLTRRLSGLAR
jgi:predicted nucleotidyltransferase component of viral defense system